jgi:hypothetical protein
MSVNDNILDFLKSNSLLELEIQHGVQARRSACLTKFSLNYNQFSSKAGDVVAEQCRGIVVRPVSASGLELLGEDNWQEMPLGDCRVLARTMLRFYNHGEHCAAQIDWSDKNLHVMEKLDGTMIALYWDDLNGAWRAATRSVPDADIPFSVPGSWDQDLTMTFSELFWDAYQRCADMNSVLNKSYTYIFELTSRYNKIVVNYDLPQITLLSIIETDSGREFDIYSDFAQKLVPAIARPKKWALDSVAAIGALVNSLSPQECEGSVVCDSAFRRIKIKSVGYVLSARSKEMIDSSPRAALQSIIDGSIDDVIPYLEADIAVRFEDLRNRVASFFQKMDASFHEMHADSFSQKEFAHSVLASGLWSAPLFQMRKMAIAAGHGGEVVSMDLWIREMNKNGRLTPVLLNTLYDYVK